MTRTYFNLLICPSRYVIIIFSPLSMPLSHSYSLCQLLLLHNKTPPHLMAENNYFVFIMYLWAGWD